jgi:hypothetical protein
MKATKAIRCKDAPNRRILLSSHQDNASKDCTPKILSLQKVQRPSNMIIQLNIAPSLIMISAFKQKESLVVSNRIRNSSI